MLEKLRFVDCKGEDVMPDLQNLERLEPVFLFDCQVKDLSGLSNLTALEHPLLHSCAKLERSPEFEKLTKLRHLGIRQCDDFRGWPCAIGLCSLQWLSVDKFSLMKIMLGLETLKCLRELELLGQGFENALGMASYSQLQCLRLGNLLTSKALDLSNFPKLEELWMNECSAIKSVTCGIILTAVSELRVYDCEILVEIPDLSTFPQSEKIYIMGCRALRELTYSEPLTNMKKLEISDCEIEMPEQSRFPKLKVFCQKYMVSVDNAEDDKDEAMSG